jgi:hypothetical protein
MSVTAQERLQSREDITCPPEALAFLEAWDRGETDGISCWRAPDVERREGSQIEGRGLIALTDIPPGQLIAVKQGHVVDSRTVKDNAVTIQGSHQQIDRNSFLAGLTADEVDKNLVGYNHSCNPNARIALFKDLPLAFLVTKTAIGEGDEITTDYSVTQSSDTCKMEVCKCGSANCRGFVLTLWDWEDETFQNEHDRELAWYIKDMIEERAQANPDILQAHSEYAPLKLASMIRIADDHIEDLLQQKEMLFATQLADFPFQRLLRRLLEKTYADSQAGQNIVDFQAIQLSLAAYLCVLSVQYGIKEVEKLQQELDLGIEHEDVLR